MLASVDSLLRCEGRHAVGGGKVPWLELTLMMVAGGFVYGGVMGSYSALAPLAQLRPLQQLYSGIKVPMLLGVSSLICLPSFFVLNTLLGLRADFAAACRGILAAQATLAVCLTALAPITVVIYVSIDHYRLAILSNGVLFAVATVAAQMLLGRHYRPLVAKNRRHRIGKFAWVSLYIFVAIQMAWVLRPFVGAPGMETQFFREEAWSNAYVKVLVMIWNVLKGGG